MPASKGWSLDSADWTLLNDALSHQWKRTFLGTDYRAEVPTSSGVYLMCVHAPLQGKLKERLYSAVYVGQAKNLRNRFDDHIRGYGDVVSVRTTFGRIHFWYTLVESANLSQTEQRLIDALGPSANKSNAVRARVGSPIDL